MAVTYASNTFTITQNASTAGTGTISGAPTTVMIGGIAQPATQITGVGTNFTGQLRAGSLIVAGANQFIVHSVTSNTSLIGFLRNNTDASASFASTAFTFFAPTTFAQLMSEAVFQMNTVGASIVQADSRSNISFVNSALTINANAVLVADNYVSLTFGNNATNRLNLNTDGVLILRNGGYININGNVGFNWFNGWLNVPNGELTWQGYIWGAAGTRQDFLNSTIRSNGIANFTQISSGGAAGPWRHYVLYDSVGSPPKIGSTAMVNSIQTASTGATEGVYLQFQNGTYANVTFPSTTSTLGTVQPYYVYLSRSSGRNTTLRSPSFPGSSYALGFDLATGVVTDSYLVNEVWPDNGGTPGTITLGATNGGGGQRHHRIYEWNPGTYFTAGGWNVRLRDSQATPVVVQNGIVTASTALQMEWQMVTATMTTVTPVNYGPFKLLARKPGFASRYETFTPTAPRTESFLPQVDATYTSDQSGRTGISANNATNTITIASGTHTLDQVYDWFQWWMAQNAQMAAYPDIARVDSVSGTRWSLPTGWTLVVNSGATLNSGVKLTTIFVPTITNNGTITGVYETSAGSSSTLELRDVSNGSAYCVYNATTGATIAYGVNNTGSNQTYRVYFAPGSAGTMIGIVKEKYGFQRNEEVVALQTGLSFLVASDVEDVGISQKTQATVAAYTTIENADKFYDYTALFRLTEAGIKLGQITTRDGTSLKISAPYSVKVNQNASAVYAISGNTITIKSTSFGNGSKYTTTVLTPPAALTATTNEAITADLEDANGDSSVKIQAATNSTFELWKIPNATPPDNYATGTNLGTAAVGKYRFMSAPGFKMVIRDATTNYRVVISMDKGIYSADLFFGSAVQLAQAALVEVINDKVDVLTTDIAAIKGSGFTSATDSLSNVGDRLPVINRNVQKASLLIPATEQLP